MAQTKAQLLGPVVGDVTIDASTLSLDAENNKVGIGTTEADLRLHVNGPNALPSSSGSTATGHLTLRDKAGSATHGMFMGVSNASPFGSWIQSQDSANNATNYPLLLNPNGGNIGIGTNSPSTNLHLSSGGATQLTISNTSNSLSDGATMGTIDFSAGSSNTVNARVAGAVEGTSEAGGDLVFETRADGGSLEERLRIDSSGNIGQGSATPTTPNGSNADNPNNGLVFTMYGDSPAINLVHNVAGGSAAADDYAAINFGRTGSSTNPYRAVIGYKQSDDILRINAKNSIAFDTGGDINSGERLRIDSAGRMGLGVTPPTGYGSGRVSLDIHSSGATVSHLALTNSTTGSNGSSNGFNIIQSGLNTLLFLRESGFMSFSTAGTEAVCITSAGNVEVGPSGAPATTITAAGNATFAGVVISGTTPNWGSATSTGIELNPAAATNYIGIKNSSASTVTNTAFQINHGLDVTTSILNSGAATFAGIVKINQTAQQGSTSKLEVTGTLDNSYPQYSYPIMVSDDAPYNSSGGPGGGIGFSFKQNSSGGYAQAGGMENVLGNKEVRY